MINQEDNNQQLNSYVDELEKETKKGGGIPINDLVAHHTLSNSSNPYNDMEDRLAFRTRDLFLSQTRDPNMGHGTSINMMRPMTSINDPSGNMRMTRKQSKQQGPPAYHQFPFTRGASRDQFLTMPGAPQMDRDYSLFGGMPAL